MLVVAHDATTLKYKQKLEYINDLQRVGINLFWIVLKHMRSNINMLDRAFITCMCKIIIIMFVLIFK